jgi:SAM-dependent methyltransferase
MQASRKKLSPRSNFTSQRTTASQFGAKELEPSELSPETSQESCVLDFGTGTGPNLRLLRELHVNNVTGLKNNEMAIQSCLSKGLGERRCSDICAMPSDDRSFDFVLATDVVEHVEDDSTALLEVARVLKDGGKALVAVPAFSSLWRLQDEVVHQKSRYRMEPLLQKMRAAGLEPLRYYYFNYLLFAPIWMAGRLIAFFGIKPDSKNEINSLFNRCLIAIFAFDVSTAPNLHPPFGVSILAAGQKARNT